MVFLHLLGISLLTVQLSTGLEPSCKSKVFCQGTLLHTVQMAQIFEDSKTFVDMKMINNETTTLNNFKAFLHNHNQNPNRNQIKKFVHENFEEYQECEHWVPPDFTHSPNFLLQIQDEGIRSFAQNLVNIWPKLTRKMKQEVLDSPEHFSILPVKNGFVVPGGRFREFYYWDSYWIVKGLLLSEMHETVKGMLDNFVSIVKRYEFVPDGARIYYLDRSQPPLLTLMVAAYIEATNDTTWLRQNINTLDKELQYFIDNKVTEVVKNGVKYHLAHYVSKSGTPRPESYFDDVMTANFFQSEEERAEFYEDLKSAAESGWDFSSRWFVDKNGDPKGNITFTQTRRIIPVDLNAFLCQVFRKMSEFYVILKKHNRANFWLEKSTVWQKTVEKVLYNEDDGIWYDWDNKLGKARKLFYPSNLAPLWSGAYDPADAKNLGRKAVKYLIGEKVLQFEGGIPASLINTGEQWDYPNAWAPLQSIVIFGLDRSGDRKAQQIAEELAQKWIKSNLLLFQQTNELFEKYNAKYVAEFGVGGEYQVQTGFGWTLGVLLELIERYYT